MYSYLVELEVLKLAWALLMTLILRASSKGSAFFFIKIFHEHYQSVKQSGSTSGSVLIWVQIFFKGYQQKTKVVPNTVRVKVGLSNQNYNRDHAGTIL